MLFGRDSGGDFKGVEIKSDILGVSNGTQETRQVDLLYDLVGRPFADPRDATAARTWLREHLPPPDGLPAISTIGTLRVEIRLTTGGGYLVLIGDVPPPS